MIDILVQQYFACERSQFLKNHQCVPGFTPGPEMVYRHDVIGVATTLPIVSPRTYVKACVQSSYRRLVFEHADNSSRRIAKIVGWILMIALCEGNYRNANAARLHQM